LILKLVHGVLVSQGSFLPSSVFLGYFVFALGEGTRRKTDGQTDRTAVAMATRSPGSSRQGILTPPAKYQVDQTTDAEVMGIFRQQRN